MANGRGVRTWGAVAACILGTSTLASCTDESDGGSPAAGDGSAGASSPPESTTPGSGSVTVAPSTSSSAETANANSGGTDEASGAGGAAGDSTMADTATGGSGGTENSDSGDASDDPTQEGSAGAGSDDDGPQSGAGGAQTSTTGDVIELPEGSREYEHIVNLVNPDAVQQVEDLLRGDGEAGLTAATTQFYQYYLDEYDFLFILTDHEVADATATATFIPITRPAQAATGDVRAVDRSFEHGSERLLGAIGGQGDSSPPLEHELAHYWAAHLDPSLGFGQDRDGEFSSHWGLTSVHGQLGGWDESTLECFEPAGALPPDCTPGDDGRFSYLVDRFAPHVNRSADYAPLELYLMGLLPVSEMPDRTLVFEDCSWTDTTVDEATDKYLIQAGGIGEIPFTDVLALHGEVPLKSDEERAFAGAFLVVSDAPASDEILAQVSAWQEAFGNHGPATGGLESFEARTGGRATLNTRLGRRRTTTDPLPEPKESAECSVLLQDCGEGLGCYSSSTPYCAVAGTVPEYGACEANPDCMAGFSCPSRINTCARYCDPDPDSEMYCYSLCEGSFIPFSDSDGNPTGAAYCLPPE